MAWKRTGKPDDKFRISFEVITEREPELAKWIWSQPWGSASKNIREVLCMAAKMVAEKNSGVIPDQSDFASARSSVAPVRQEPVYVAPAVPQYAPAQQVVSVPVVKQAEIAREPYQSAQVQNDVGNDASRTMAESAARAMRMLDDQF